MINYAKGDTAMENKEKITPNDETEVITDLLNKSETIRKEEPVLPSLDSLLYDSDDDILPAQTNDEGPGRPRIPPPRHSPRP